MGGFPGLANVHPSLIETARKELKKLKLYGVGQDLPSDAFSENIRGPEPGSAEMEFAERK